MTKPLRIDDEAAGEVDAAAEWYQLRGPTLGVEFIAEVRDGLARVASFPGLGPPAPGVAEALECAGVCSAGFPTSSCTSSS